MRAHRFAWAIHNGPITDGKHVCHTCDTPACVNPAHLFLGTPADNTADKVQKGRAKGGCPPGSGHHRAKLHESDIPAIRAKKSHMSLNALAREYGVSKRAIHFIVHGRHWKHV